jgi:hypothetical protein
VQAFDDAEQEQHKQRHRPQKGLAWMLGRKSGGPPPHVKQLQYKASEGAAWVQSRIKPLLASLKAKASGRDQKRRYTRAEVEQIARALSAEARAKDRAQAAAEAYPEGYGYHDSYDSNMDSYSRDGRYSSSRPHQQRTAELYGHPDADRDLVLTPYGAAANADRDLMLTPYGAASDAEGSADGTAAEVMAVLDAAEEPQDALWQEAAGEPEDALTHTPQQEAQHDGHGSKGDRKGLKRPPHQSPSAAHAEAKKHAKAAKAAHASSDAASPSSNKAKHKKVHTAAVGARSSKHAAHTVNADQLLDDSEATEIKNILDAIYGTSRSGETPGLDAATLSDIQAALQPHFITDDPESYAFGFGEDSSTGGSIPSEQAVLADQKNLIAAAAPSPAKQAPSKSSLSPAPATKPSKVAARTDKSAGVAPAPTVAVDEEIEVVYIEEEVDVEEGEDAAFSTEAVPETDDKDAETGSAASSSKEKTAQSTEDKEGSSSGKGSQQKSGSSSSSKASKQGPKHDAAEPDNAAGGSQGNSKAPSQSGTSVRKDSETPKASVPKDTESKPAAAASGRSQGDSKSSSAKVAAAGHGTSSRSSPEAKLKTKLMHAKEQEMQPEEEPPLRDTEAARSFSAQWDEEEEQDMQSARLLSKSDKGTKSEKEPQQPTAAKAGSKGSTPAAPAQSCPAGSVPTEATKCACKAGFFSQDGTPFAEGGCTPCPAGSIAGAQGSTKCRKCAPNTFANRAATECSAAAAAQQQ